MGKLRLFSLRDSYERRPYINHMMDDQQMATNLATQLLQQLDSKIHSTPNDPDKYVMKRNLNTYLFLYKVSPEKLLFFKYDNRIG